MCEPGIETLIDKVVWDLSEPSRLQGFFFLFFILIGNIYTLKAREIFLRPVGHSRSLKAQ